MILICYLTSKFITRIDTEDDNDEDTVEFTLVNKWEFKPKLNNGLTGDEIITVFNPGEYSENLMSLQLTFLIFDISMKQF